MGFNGVANWVEENSQTILLVPILLNILFSMFETFSNKTNTRDKLINILTCVTTSINLLPCLSLLILEAYSIRAGFSGGILGILLVPIGSLGMLLVITLAVLFGIGVPNYIANKVKESDSTSSLFMLVLGMIFTIIVTFLAVKWFVNSNFSNDV